MIVAVYLLIASAAIVGIVLALRYQKLSDVIVTAIVIAVALIYWLAYLHRRAPRRGANALASVASGSDGEASGSG